MPERESKRLGLYKPDQQGSIGRLVVIVIAVAFVAALGGRFYVQRQIAGLQDRLNTAQTQLQTSLDQSDSLTDEELANLAKDIAEARVKLDEDIPAELQQQYTDLVQRLAALATSTNAETAATAQDLLEQLTNTAGTGIAVSGPNKVTISNTGVLSVNGGNGDVTVQGTANQLTVSGSGSTVLLSLPQDIATTSSPTFANVNVSGSLNVSTIGGDGSAVTNVDAVTLQGNGASYFTNASNLSSGTLADARLSSNVALKDQANAFTTGQTIQTGAAGTVGLTIQGAVGQTGNLQEWQNSTGTALASLNASGALRLGFGSAGSPALTFQEDADTGFYRPNSNTVGVTTNGGEVARFNAYGLGIGGNTPTGESLNVKATTPSRIAVIVQGAASQTANLQEWQDSSGTANSYIGADGVSGLLGRAISFSSSAGYSGGYNTALTVTGSGASGNGGVLQVRTSGDAIFTLDARNRVFTLNSLVQSRIEPVNSTAKGLMIRGKSGQTGNLQEWQNSSGTVLSNFTSEGALQVFSTGDAFGSPQVLVQSSGTTGYGLRVNNSSGDGFLFSNTPTTSVLQALTSSTAARDMTLSGSNLILRTGSVYTDRLTINNDGNVLVNGFTSSTVGLTVKGAASQTANLQQWQNSSGGVLTAISSSGSLIANSGITTTDGNLNFDAYGSYITIPTSKRLAGADHGTYITLESASPAKLAGYRGWKVSAVLGGGLTPLTVSGAAVQSANLQEWQNNSGTVLASVDSSGRISATGGNDVQPGFRFQGDTDTGFYQWNNQVMSTTGGNWSFLFGNNKRNYINTTTTGTSALTIVPGLTSDYGLVVRGRSGQTANLQEWQNSGGTVLASVTNDGRLTVGTSTADSDDAWLTVRKDASDHLNSVQHLQTAAGGQGYQNKIIIKKTYSDGSSTTGAIVGSVDGVTSNGTSEFTAGSLQFTHGSVAGRGNLSLYTSNSSTLTKAMSIDHEGRLYVGNTSPSTNARLFVDVQTANLVGSIIQGAASQTANLQEWQNNAGTVLASISAGGNLEVIDATVNGNLVVDGTATFNGTLTVNGHIISGNTSGSTTIAAGVAAGVGASASISGNDTAGTVTLTTGTGATSGTLATITFASSYGSAPRVMLSASDADTAALQVYRTSTTTTFVINVASTPTDSTTYEIDYFVVQ